MTRILELKSKHFKLLFVVLFIVLIFSSLQFARGQMDQFNSVVNHKKSESNMELEYTSNSKEIERLREQFNSVSHSVEFNRKFMYRNIIKMTDSLEVELVRVESKDIELYSGFKDFLQFLNGLEVEIKNMSLLSISIEKNEKSSGQKLKCKIEIK